MRTRVFTEGHRLVNVEECEESPRDLSCPCCKGKGVHQVFDGPDTDSYPCTTCGGDRYFEVRTE